MGTSRGTPYLKGKTSVGECVVAFRELRGFSTSGEDHTAGLVKLADIYIKWCYISDVMPSRCRNTGWLLTHLFRRTIVYRKRTIVAADVVELEKKRKLQACKYLALASIF